ncbi:MAG: hypothetical protein RR296_11955 [Clostridia bacterium]
MDNQNKVIAPECDDIRRDLLFDALMQRDGDVTISLAEYRALIESDVLISLVRAFAAKEDFINRNTLLLIVSPERAVATPQEGERLAGNSIS